MQQASYIKNGDGDYLLKTAVIPYSGQPIVIAEPTFSKQTSVTANGKQAAPAANTDIAVTANLPQGTWDVEARLAVLGTTVANIEATNMVFRIGNTTVATPTVNVPGTAGSTAPTTFKMRVTLGAATPVSIRSGGTAATAGSIYVADIVATPWEGP